MLSIIHKPFFRNISIAIVVILILFGCSTTPIEITDKLNLVDSIIEERPDTALTILRSIDTCQIKGKEDLAKYALLHSMALDKNNIEVTEFNILQPAMDYYYKHGNPDERLKTHYYHGRIFMNRKENEAALNEFLKAAEDSTECTDELAYARLLIAEGYMYVKEYKYNEYKKCNLKAADIYKNHNDTIRRLGCLARALGGANYCVDSITVNSLLPECIENALKYKSKVTTLSMAILHSLNLFAYHDKLLDFANKISTDSIIVKKGGLALAAAYANVGHPEIAEKILEQAEVSDSIDYYITKIQIMESKNDIPGKLEAEERFIERNVEYYENILSNHLIFTREEYAIEIQHAKEIKKKEKIIYIIGAGSVFLILLVIIIAVALRYNHIKRLYAEQEQTNLKIRLTVIEQELSEERENLQNLLEENNALSERMQMIITQRIEMLNGIIATEISKQPHYSVAYNDLLESMQKNKTLFMNRIQENFSISHPKFIEYLKGCGLNEEEIGYACLYALGLRGKDISQFIGGNSHYKKSSAIRKKLSLGEHDTNLSLYIQTLLKQI